MKKIIKKSISLLLIMIMVSSIVMVAPFTSEARTSTTTTKSGDFEYTLEINNIDDGTTWIEKYIGNDTKVIIPEEIKGRKVVGISSEAFKDCQQITDISIPNSVKNWVTKYLMIQVGIRNYLTMLLMA